MRKIILKCMVVVLMITQLMGCAGESKKEQVSGGVPDWSINATIYEVNIRQYTKEGTFKAFEEHLPRLQAMGIKILWFMPIHPISLEKRAGTLGSYYSIADYQDINPEFGSKKDFKHLVDKCHKMGFKVMMDWVANHTGWDNEWISKHPDWYTQDAEGNIIFPETWEDVADLNYDNEDMQKEMLKAMTYWVEKYDVDGYRCDYAGGVPLEFWETARKELDKIKPVYMLAEDNTSRDLMKKAFDANYGWDLYRDLNNIARGYKKADILARNFKNVAITYPQGAYPINFIDNHDENSWNGTVKERMGDAQQAMLTLIFTVPGMPLLYSGQEVNLDFRLQFFDKDMIVWDDFVNEELLTKLIHLKLDNPALWNGDEGGKIVFLETSNSNVLAYTRQKDENQIVVLMNLSAQTITAKLQMEQEFKGKELLTSEDMTLIQGENRLTLNPWEFVVLRK